jgi:hypothetical protein
MRSSVIVIVIQRTDTYTHTQSVVIELTLLS